MKGSRRSLDVECMLCGAAPGKSCVKGHVSLLYGSSKEPRGPHVVYPGQKPFPIVKSSSWLTRERMADAARAAATSKEMPPTGRGPCGVHVSTPAQSVQSTTEADLAAQAPSTEA